jgi:diguanylate cyclase (GGDEF)-like protein
VQISQDFIDISKNFIVDTCILTTFIYALNRIKPLCLHKSAADNISQGICWHCTAIYALAAIAVMNFPVVLIDGWQIDMRVVPLVLAGYYLGFYTGTAASCIVYLYRIWLGGAGVGVSAMYLFCGLFGALAARYFPRNRTWLSYLGLVLAGNGILVVVYLYIYFIEPERLILYREVWLPRMILTSLCLVLTSGVINDSINLNTQRRKLERYAITDGLTGLFNHRYFQDQFRLMLENAQEWGWPCSVVLLDIDYFKRYNDTFGHPEGDQLLKQLATILTEITREADLAARYGGEEFVIIFPNTTAEDARAITMRILAEVRHYPFVGCKNLPNGCVTISAGIACYPNDGYHKAALIERADAALYYAKETGRDRVVLYAEIPKSAMA